jgi:hypothetical protein
MKDERGEAVRPRPLHPPSFINEVVAAPARGRCVSHIRIEERTVGYHNDAKHTVGVSVLRQPGPSAVARGRSTFLVRK